MCCIYENGIQNGWMREYINNKPSFTGIYKNGKIISELRDYNGNSNFVEEVQNNERIAIRHYNGEEYLEGICYCFKNEEIISAYQFKSGEKDKMLYDFVNGRMIMYDITGKIVYQGEYEGSFESGFKKNGRGEEYCYKDNVLYKIEHVYTGNNIGYDLIEGKILKQYEENQLVYEGGWCMKDIDSKYDNENNMKEKNLNGDGLCMKNIESKYDNEKNMKEKDVNLDGLCMKNMMIVRHGEGLIYSSSSLVYRAVFDNGKELRKVMNIKDDEMLMYDDEKRVIYKGGFGDRFIKKGRGLRYEYEKGKIKRVFVCENGEDVYKWIELNGNTMIEFDEDGLKVYKGGMSEESDMQFIRNGEGELFNNGDQLIYSGEWKNGKREGKGSCYNKGDVVYIGEWKDDKPNGNGQYLNSNGNIVWEGNWKNGYGDMGNGVWLSYEDGKKCGLYENGNRKYEGEWKDGKPDGRGVWFDENGNKKYEGIWENGLFHVNGRIWFNYEIGKEKRVFSMEKKKVKKEKKEKWMTIKRIANYMTSKKDIVNWKIVLPISIIIIIGILIAIIHGWYMSIITVKLDYDQNTKEIILDTNNCNKWKRYLSVVEYPNLERIIIDNNACNNVRTVEIKNNPKLITLKTGDGSFKETTSLTLSSIY